MFSNKHWNIVGNDLVAVLLEYQKSLKCVNQLGKIKAVFLTSIIIIINSGNITHMRPFKNGMNERNSINDTLHTNCDYRISLIIARV